MTSSRRQLLLVTAGHFTIDAYSNCYAPLLPMLIPRLGLSLAMAGTLAMCFQAAASLAQLLFGQIADRWSPRRLLILGPIVAGLLLSAIGIAPSTTALAALLVAGGLGVAAYHPSGAALTHLLGGRRPGLAMSIYISGGSLGVSLGPLLFAPIASHWGPQWLLLVSLLGLTMGALLYWNTPAFSTAGARHPGQDSLAALRPYFKPLALLYAIVVLRTLTAMSFSTFVPVLLTRRGMSMSYASFVVAAYLLATGAGGFVGGALADRFGPRRMMILTLLLAVPPLVAAPVYTGATFAVLLGIGGFFVQSTLPVNVTFAQALAPVSAATVSSLMMGFAWGTAGLCVPFVGMLADGLGLADALRLTALAPLVAGVCAVPLPARAHLPRTSRAAMVSLPEVPDID